MTDKELDLKEMAIDYGFSDELVIPVAVEFTNAKGFGFGDGEKLGRYLPLQNKIQLYDGTTAEDISPIYYHELVHALQHKEYQKMFGNTFGTVLYWMALTFLRNRMEKDAVEMEDRLWDKLENK